MDGKNNIIGKIFGNWEVIGPKNKKSQIKCMCSCGYIGYVPPTSLEKGLSTMCRNCRIKIQNSHEKDLYLVGKKIGDWTIICFDSLKQTTGRYLRMFKCRCKCGIEKLITSGELKRESTKRCRNCANELKKIIPFDDMWETILRGAARRSLSVETTKEFVFLLLEKQNFKCALSGIDIYLAESVQDSHRGKGTASLDRIDSNLGYTENNVQWVHKIVNKMKQDFTQERFLQLCDLVAARQMDLI